MHLDFTNPHRLCQPVLESWRNSQATTAQTNAPDTFASLDFRFKKVFQLHSIGSGICSSGSPILH
jgi:hypothetical protein